MIPFTALQVAVAAASAACANLPIDTATGYIAGTYPEGACMYELIAKWRLTRPGWHFTWECCIGYVVPRHLRPVAHEDRVSV